MEIKLTNEESLKLFYNSLCNGLSTFCQSGLQLDFDADTYNIASAKEPVSEGMSGTCFEDVLIQILKDGGTLTATDLEGGKMTRSVKLQDVYDRVPKTPAKWLLQMANEEDDATTADCILQTVFFESIIFG